MLRSITSALMVVFILTTATLASDFSSFEERISWFASTAVVTRIEASDTANPSANVTKEKSVLNVFDLENKTIGVECAFSNKTSARLSFHAKSVSFANLSFSTVMFADKKKDVEKSGLNFGFNSVTIMASIQRTKPFYNNMSAHYSAAMEFTASCMNAGQHFSVWPRLSMGLPIFDSVEKGDFYSTVSIHLDFFYRP